MTDQEKIIEDMARATGCWCDDCLDRMRRAFAICAPAVRERCAEEARKWGEDQVAKWADDEEMCDDAKARAWDANCIANAIAALPLDGLTGGKGESELEKLGREACEMLAASAPAPVQAGMVMPRAIEADDGEPGDVEYLLVMLRSIASGDLDARTAKMVAQTGLELYEKGSRRCYEDRGEPYPDDEEAALAAASAKGRSDV